MIEAQIYLYFDKKNESPFQIITGKDFHLIYFRTCIGVPSATSAASIVISPNVG
jgi:hypothetical protein